MKIDSAQLVGWTLGGLVLFPVVILLGFYHGFVLWMMWGWFMVPLGVPPITVAWAMGIFFTVTLFRGASPRKLKRELLATPTAVDDVMDLLRPLIVLAIGYLLKGFM